MQVIDFEFIDRLLDTAALGQQVRQAIADRSRQRLVQMTLAHIGIDQYDALPALSNDRRQVRGDKRLADLGARTGNHDPVVGRIQPRKMQTGSQAAYRFDGQIRRVTQRQQKRLVVGTIALPDFFTVLFLLQGAVRNRGIDRQSELLDGFRPLESSAQRFTHQHQGNTDKPAQESRNQNDQGFAGFDRGGDVDIRRIDQPRIANRPCPDDVQFLGFIQKLGIDLCRHFHITGQVQQFLLRSRKLLDLFLQPLSLFVQISPI